MKKPQYLLLTAAAVLLFASCFEPIQDEELLQEGISFPKQLPDAGTGPESKLLGTLELAGNCLQVREESSGRTYTPIWLAGFDFQLMPDSSYAILNASGNEVARSGIGIQLSGWTIDDEQDLQGLVEGGTPKLLLSCPIPYWQVGSEVKALELDARLPPGLRAELPAWYDFYTDHVPDWRLSAFRLYKKWSLGSLVPTAQADLYPLASRPDNWLILSPDGRFNVDLYARDILLDDRGTQAKHVYAVHPEPEVALEDIGQEKRLPLLYGDKNRRFEAAYWENDQSIVIAGLQRDETDQFHPSVWRVQLDKKIVQQYRYPTPLVHPFPYSYVQERVLASR